MNTVTTKIATAPSVSTMGVVANQIYTYTKGVFKENAADRDNVELTPFGTCLVSLLSNNNNDNLTNSKHIKIKDSHETFVNCELVNNKLILSKASVEDIEASYLNNKEKLKRKTAGTLKIRHFEQCPANQMSETQRDALPESVKIRNIGVAVAVLLGELRHISINFFFNFLA